ncbi:outer membrane beta-barrel protein [Granulicella sp. L60]|jgi:outer membrane immunogenic protein|uniref:outer membrane beta-barrel protein n=1 Tax=Granulicella sp. L60 TaxID=1641866 RepID=UPI00131CEC2C|nr:outer membrane beta-barrel protein [Granulicella sp. L60]
MKKTMLLLGALMLSAAAGYAQESRQDASISATVPFAPQVTGNSVQENMSMTIGLLASYRYLLTPRSGLEVNYSYAQNTHYYQVFGQAQGGIHTLQQEISAAYVFGLNFKRYNPFLEAGPGAMIFSPFKDAGTTNLDVKQQTIIGGLFGGGVAYELSPSFDIRAGYRGFVGKTPDFDKTGNVFKTNRYQLISTPSIGIAYHF